MYKMAVIGKDVSKSDSAKMHTFDFRALGSACSYELLSVAKENFDEAAKKLIAEYDAFNVTIPYKLDIIPYLDRLEGDAKTFGAVNVVKDKVGYNTDGVGFMLMLENNGISPRGKKILVTPARKCSSTTCARRASTASTPSSAASPRSKRWNRQIMT